VRRIQRIESSLDHIALTLEHEAELAAFERDGRYGSSALGP
jgi:hypothetical protein